RIAERAADIGRVERLGGHTPLQELADALARGVAFAPRKIEPGRREDSVRRTAVGATDRAIADRVGGRRTLLERPTGCEHLDPRDEAPRLPTVAACVHRERTADRPRDAGQELGAREVVARGE